MKKLLLLFFVIGQLSYSQQVDVLSINLIEKTEAGGFYYPAFSPGNQFLIATDASYNGLKMINFSDNSIHGVTNVQGAGYGMRISADETTILFRKTEVVKGLKYSSLHSYFIKTNKHKQIIPRTRDQFTASFSGNKPFYVKGTKLKRETVPTKLLVSVVQIEDRKMVLYNGKVRTVLTPNGEDASYIWPSVSPDGKKIVYTVSGRGTFVCDIKGQNIQSIGKLSAPKWLNNSLIVGMDDKDNGDQVVSSVVIVASVDGRMRQALTSEKEYKAMYPAASADGKKIVFCTDKGQLFLINIDIK